MVADLIEAGTEPAQHLRADDIVPCGRHHNPLDTVAASPLLHQLDEPRPLELAQMVVQLLPRQAEATREPGRGLRLAQPLEQPQPLRLQQGRRLRRRRARS